jgi:hypothetical protein
MAPMLFSEDANLRADEMYMPRNRRSSGEVSVVRTMPFVLGHRLPPFDDDGRGRFCLCTSKHDDDICGVRWASALRRDDGKVMGWVLFIACPLCI